MVHISFSLLSSSAARNKLRTIALMEEALKFPCRLHCDKFLCSLKWSPYQQCTQYCEFIIRLPSLHTELDVNAFYLIISTVLIASVVLFCIVICIVIHFLVMLMLFLSTYLHLFSLHKIKDVTYLPYFCLPSILAVNTSPWKIDLLQWHKYLEVFRLCTVLLMPYCTILFVHNVSYFIA